MKTDQDTVLIIEGMDCANCALGIKKQLDRTGLDQVNVNFATAEVSFRNASKEQVDNAILKINTMGYKVVANISDDQSIQINGLSRIELKFYFSIIFTIPLLTAMFIPLNFIKDPYFQLILCLPVYILGIWHFGRSAYFSIRSGVPTMDVLIALGTTAAFFYSLTGTILNLGHNYQFYETSASIISLVLLGNMLEHKAVKKTTSAIDELVKMQRTTAKLISNIDNIEKVTEIEASKIRKNDFLLVNSGDKIPTDGIVTWGEGNTDESVITGESLEVEKEIGSKVIGGTILTSGNIKMQAIAIGNQSVLGQIIELVKNAQQDKPKLQNLADKISAIFVPVVILISLLTLALNFYIFDINFQHSLVRSIAVLVIACPCALGLAIPTAVIVGVGRVAKQGILIKGASTIQKINDLKTLVFDKTGTLTTGKFKIQSLNVYNITEKEAKSVLYSLEKYSTHPIAISITNELNNEIVIELKEVYENKGIGVTAIDTKGNNYSVGSYRVAKSFTPNASHSLYLIKNNNLVATIDLLDELRPDVIQTINFLKSKGIRIILLSGDKKAKCEQIDSQLHFDEVYYEKLPSEKLKLIEGLNLNNDVGMVGDGINDAPALAKATIGISLSEATQIAIKSAQVILLNGRINQLSKAWQISHATMQVIKQNLFWAFFYNILAIPLAASGLLNPMIAAGSMALSDIVVILNSLRLRSKKLKS
ncbi:MAG: cation-translocating P-type ATPase [Bacteroidota bacterium]